AIRLLVLCREAGFELRISDLNNTSTIRSQAERALSSEGVAEDGTAVQYAPFDSLDEETIERLKTNVIPGIDMAWDSVVDVAPATPLQRGLISETMRSDSGDAYVTWKISEFGASMDAERLRRALVQMVASRSIMRTRFALDPILGVVQVVADEQVSEELVPQVEYCQHASEVKERALAISKDDRWGRPQSSPLHVQIVSAKDEATSMVWFSHHALHDGWSFSVMEQEWRKLYDADLDQDGDVQGVIGADVPFTNVARYLAGRDNEDDLKFWQTYLADAEPVRLASGSSSGLPAPDADAQKTVSHTTKCDLSSVARACAVPPSTVFLFALATALGLFADSDDISFGLILSGRTLPVNDIARVIGPCINTAICRVRLQQDQSAAAALQQLQAELDEINERGYLGLPEIGRTSSTDSASISTVLAEFNNLTGDANKSSNAATAPIAGADSASGSLMNTWLFVTAAPHAASGLEIVATVDERVLAPHDAASLIRHVASVLEHLADSAAALSCEHLSVLRTPEQERILAMCSQDSQLRQPDLAGLQVDCDALHELVQAQIRQAPKKVAVQFERSGFITYEQLGSMSDMLAHALQLEGVTIGSIVPVCLHRTMEMIVVMLAVLKAGAAYAPIDPAQPRARKELILTQLSAPLLLASNPAESDLPEGPWTTHTVQDLLNSCQDQVANYHPQAVPASALAYVLFTSGSTGVPKGVMIEHRSVSAYIAANQGMGFETPFGRRLSFPPITFDVSVGDIWGTLVRGGCLSIAPQGDLQTNLDKVLQDSITRSLFMTPSVALALRAQLWPSLSTWLDTLYLGGEACTAELQEVFTGSARLCNVYGPTEATVQGTYGDFNLVPGRPPCGAAFVPIGRPMGQSSIYILKPDTLQLLPIGAVGELCIGGPQVARGYLNDEAKTKAKFVSDPFVEGGRMFRT
ncbi:hypothetical protein OC834_007748, partial [Tilletia horrida]